MHRIHLLTALARDTYTSTPIERDLDISNTEVRARHFNYSCLPRAGGSAARSFREAADQGDVNAEVNLVLMFENGLGVKQDLEEALRWFRTAAHQGDAEAEAYALRAEEKLNERLNALL